MVTKTATKPRVAAKAAPETDRASGTTAERTSNKRIDGLIKSASSHVTNFRDTVQEAGVAIIEHAHEYGDCSRAKHLCRVVPARERNSLIGWFALYSPIGIAMGKTQADDKCRFNRDTSKMYHDFNIEGAKANNWFDDPARANPEPKPLKTLIDFYNDLDSLLKRMIAQAEAEEEKNKVEPHDRAALRHQATELRKLVGKYRATHVTADNDTEEGKAPSKELEAA